MNLRGDTCHTPFTADVRLLARLDVSTPLNQQRMQKPTHLETPGGETPTDRESTPRVHQLWQTSLEQLIYSTCVLHSVQNWVLLTVLPERAQKTLIESQKNA